VIHVSSLVADGIYAEAMKGCDAIPRRGGEAEVGGILVGRRGENEIVVEDFEPVRCEHRFEPCFRLSDSDLVDWRETLQRFRQGKELATVGWYRSDTGTEVALGEDDRELLETELQLNGDVILLMKASRSQPYEATLFLRDQGNGERHGPGRISRSTGRTLVCSDRHPPGRIRHPSTPAMTAPGGWRLPPQPLSSTGKRNLLVLAGRCLPNLKVMFLLRASKANTLV